MFFTMTDNPSPLPVICDRCRAEGLAGEDPFEAFGALLDFEPVPRLKKRADGWDAEVQRAYIAALSLTGSDTAACRAVQRSAFGVTQLLKHEGSEGFRAARDEALAMAADERSRRLAEGLRAVAAGEAGWRPPEPPWSGSAARCVVPVPAEPEPEDEAAEARRAADYLTALFKRYVAKIGEERTARLAGRIVAADFYLRQVTVLEVCMDLLCDGRLLDRLDELAGDQASVVQIADTPMSRALDLARRARWAELGEPERPPPPPSALLLDRIGYRLLGVETFRGGQGRDWRAYGQWCAEREADHAAAARAQVEWEEKARREAEQWRARVEAEAQARRDEERRRDSGAANDQEPGEAGRPAPEGRQD